MIIFKFFFHGHPLNYQLFLYVFTPILLLHFHVLVIIFIQAIKFIFHNNPFIFRAHCSFIILNLLIIIKIYFINFINGNFIKLLILHHF